MITKLRAQEFGVDGGSSQWIAGANMLLIISAIATGELVDGEGAYYGTSAQRVLDANQ